MYNIINKLKIIGLLGILLCLNTNTYGQEKVLKWHRPVDNPVFTINHGNNHDALLFVDTSLEYPYHLIISGWGCKGNERSGNPEACYLWRSKTFSWASRDWELVSKEFQIGCHYEYDDGIKVDNKYYIYESGIVYTYEGDIDESAGKWEPEGIFPVELCDDIGVYYEDGYFHIFGEYGDFPFGPDGTSLSHLVSKTGLGDWKLVDEQAANLNIQGQNAFGVGDPTIVKIKDEYYIYSDLESDGSPYKIIAWKSPSLNQRFEYLGVTMKPRLKETDDWDNYRVQDPDIAYIPELNRFVIVCNMMDSDGNPGGHFPTLEGQTRVVGFFYSDSILIKK